MNLMKIVNYKSAKAIYKVEYKADKTFVATLEKYMGDDAHKPPKKVSYVKAPAVGFAASHQHTTSLLEDVTNAVARK